MGATSPLKKNYVTWKNWYLKLILQKKVIRLKKWMASWYSSFQIKRTLIQRTGDCKFCFEKKKILLALAAPKNYNTSKEN